MKLAVVLAGVAVRLAAARSERMREKAIRSALSTLADLASRRAQADSQSPRAPDARQEAREKDRS